MMTMTRAALLERATALAAVLRVRLETAPVDDTLPPHVVASVGEVTRDLTARDRFGDDDLFSLVRRAEMAIQALSRARGE